MTKQSEVMVSYRQLSSEGLMTLHQCKCGVTFDSRTSPSSTQCNKCFKESDLVFLEKEDMFFDKMLRQLHHAPRK